jgi:hypothetical protein
MHLGALDCSVAAAHISGRDPSMAGVLLTTTKLKGHSGLRSMPLQGFPCAASRHGELSAALGTNARRAFTHGHSTVLLIRPMVHPNPWRPMPGVHSSQEFSEQLLLGTSLRLFNLVRLLRLLRLPRDATCVRSDVVARASRLARGVAAPSVRKWLRQATAEVRRRCRP